MAQNPSRSIVLNDAVVKEFKMNQDTLKGKWKQIRGSAKETWGKLTDDDLDVIDGQRDQLVGKVQERYGKERDAAEREVDRFLKDCDN